MKRLGKRLLAGPYLIWMLLFTVVPLVLLVYNAFTGADGSFTSSNVAAILDPVNGKPFLRSIGMSLLVTGICLVLSFPLALILRKYSSNKNSFIVMIFILPMWMNFMLRTLAWRLILLNNGILNQILTTLGFGKVYLMNTIWAVILGTVYDYLPFMVLPIYNALVKIDNDVISDVKFETFGCGSAIASSSMATEMIKGKPVSEALQLTNKAVAEALDGLPAHKLHCSVLAEEAIKSALKDYYDKNGIAYDAAQFPNCEDCAHCAE